MKLNYHHADWDPANGTIIVLTMTGGDADRGWRRVEITDPSGTRIAIELSEAEAVDLYCKLRSEIIRKPLPHVTRPGSRIRRLYAGFPPAGRKGVWAWAEMKSGKHVPLDVGWDTLLAKIEGGIDDAEG